MIIIKPIKLTPRRISSLLTIIAIIFTLTMLIFISLFLYKNFYQTITQSKEIIILREKVALDTINMEKFNLIIDKLARKTAAKQLGNIISPFR